MKTLWWGNIISVDMRKRNLQLSRPCRPCSFSIPQAWPMSCPPDAHCTWTSPSKVLPCACYSKKTQLFSDMSLLHYTSETFLCKRSLETEDPRLKTGYKSMFLNHTPPAAPDTAGRTARISQGEYFPSNEEKQDIFLQNNITETKTFLDWWTVRKHHTKSQKGRIKISLLASASQTIFTIIRSSIQTSGSNLFQSTWN